MRLETHTQLAGPEHSITPQRGSGGEVYIAGIGSAALMASQAAPLANLIFDPLILMQVKAAANPVSFQINL